MMPLAQSIRSCRPFFRKGLTIFSGLIGLYVFVFLLLGAGYIKKARLISSESLVVDSLRQSNDAYWMLHGQAPDHRYVEVGVDNRVFTTAVVDTDGRFYAYFDLPQTTSQIWIRGRDERLEETARHYESISWKPGTFPPRLNLCLYLEPTGLLWIAGRATPLEEVTLGQPDTTRIASYYTDQHGFFERFTFPGAPIPDSVYLRSSYPGPGHTIACRSIASIDAWPLSRRTQLIDDRDNRSDLIAISRADTLSAAEQAVAAFDLMHARISFDITVPSSHPAFVSLVKGDLSASDFADRFAGRVDGVLTLESLDSFRSRLSGSFPDLDRLDDFKPGMRFAIADSLVTVHIEQRILSAYQSYNGFRMTPAGAESIPSAYPLLTARDSVIIQTNDGWFYDTLPADIEADRAVWHGPVGPDVLSAKPAQSNYAFLESLATDAAARNQSQDANTLREFLRAYEFEQDADFLTMLWRLLLALIPFAALWWIAYRGTLNLSAQYLALLTLSVFHAMAICGAYLIPPFDAHLPPVLFAIVRPDVGGVESFQELLRTARIDPAISRLPSDAAWLLLSLLVGFSPVYFSQWKETIRAVVDPDAAANPEEKPSRLGTIGRWIYRSYVLVILLVLAYFSTDAGLRQLVNFDAYIPGAPGEPAPNFSGSILLAGGLLWMSILLAFGWRGLLFGAGFVALALTPVSDAFYGLPALILLGLVGAPVIDRLLKRANGLPAYPRSRWAVVLTVALAPVLSLYAPERLVLSLAAGFLGLGILWTALQVLYDVEGAGRITGLLKASPRKAGLALFGIGLAIGWPIAAPGNVLRPMNISQLLGHWLDLFPIIAGIGLALILWQRVKTDRTSTLTPDVVLIGGLFYAVYLVGPTSTWLFVPVPFLVALLLGRSILFKPEPARQILFSQLAHPGSFSKYVKELLDVRSAQNRLQLAIKTLHGEFEKAKIEPADYKTRLSDYEAYQGEIVQKESSGAHYIFSLGASSLPGGIADFIKVGLLVAFFPLLISLYQYLPTSKVSYPFPVADFVVFVSLATLKWGLYAAFFGLFYASLRGETGLSKGVYLFFAIATPYVIQRFLGASDLTEIQPLLFWLAQLFVFFSVLGVLAGDFQLLRRSGFALRDLRAVHRLPALSAFASSLVATIVPAIVALFAGKISDLVGFFIDLIIPGPPGAP